MALRPGGARDPRGRRLHLGSRPRCVVELARAIAEDRPERASGAVALHVLDVLLGIRDAAESGSAVTIESTVERPAPLPEDFDPAAAVLTA